MIYLTDIAQSKIAELAIDSKPFRITAKIDTCSDLIYETYFDEENKMEDTRYSFTGFDIIIDRESILYLDDSKLDYVEGLGFILDYSTSKGPCACGKVSISSSNPFSPCLWV